MPKIGAHGAMVVDAGKSRTPCTIARNLNSPDRRGGE